MLAIIAQMYTTLPIINSSSPTNGEGINDFLLQFSMLTHLVGWCVTTYAFTQSDSARIPLMGVWIGPIFTLLGTQIWLAAVLLRIYLTATFVFFVIICLIVTFIIFAVLFLYIIYI